MDSDKNNLYKWCCKCSGSYFWGLFFVVFGGYFLLKELEIIPDNFPLWQIILISFGIYLLFSKRKKH